MMEMDNKEFFEKIKEHFGVYEDEKNVELEAWTVGGVNMVIVLDIDDDKGLFAQFKERVNGFDVDEEIDLHRQDSRYKEAFSIKQGLEDFQAFENRLYSTLAEIQAQEKVEDQTAEIKKFNELFKLSREYDVYCDLKLTSKGYKEEEDHDRVYSTAKVEVSLRGRLFESHYGELNDAETYALELFNTFKGFDYDEEVFIKYLATHSHLYEN